MPAGRTRPLSRQKDREAERDQCETSWSAVCILEVIYSYFGGAESASQDCRCANLAQESFQLRCFLRYEAVTVTLAPTGSGCLASLSKTLLKGPLQRALFPEKEWRETETLSRLSFPFGYSALGLNLVAPEPLDAASVCLGHAREFFRFRSFELKAMTSC